MANRPLSCIMLAPYITFNDGTIGCILVINWDQPQPSVFLFDSQNRNTNNPNAAKQRTLFPYELNMLTEYINKGEQRKYYPHNEELKKMYALYGVARLCGNFMSAHIADMIAENIRRQHPGYLGDIGRTKEQLAGAHLQYTNCNLEDELLLHMSNDSLWERSILEQALPMIEPGYNHNEWLDTILLKIRTAFISNLENNTTATFGADYGYRLATAYAEDPDVKWWRVLEEAVSMQHKETGIKYVDAGIQEIIAFYGLSKYIGENKPWGDLVLNVSKVPLEKRLDIFKAYKEQVEKECMEELRKADNPLLSSMPTKQDAQKEAKERMLKHLGRTPDWLPEECRLDYSQYEQAFCKFAGIGDYEPTKEKKKIPFAKERAGIRAVHESGMCKHKADWGAVFKILVEKDIFPNTAYLAAAEFINEICTIDVTNKDALRQSPALNILGGNAESDGGTEHPKTGNRAGSYFSTEKSLKLTSLRCKLQRIIHLRSHR